MDEKGMIQGNEKIENNCYSKDVFILVITHDRPDFQISRTFPSIIAQSFPFEAVIMVDDSESKENLDYNERYLKEADFTSSDYKDNRGSWLLEYRN